jgi:hypothetical protein
VSASGLAGQIFLEFAEERAHLDLLIREYRADRASAPANTPHRGIGRQVGPIDLHTHTTASDGRCTPPELVARAAAASVTVLSVTDHDTVAGGEAAAAACRAAGIEFVAGIEVTVLDGVDVHVLGYFIDVTSPAFAAFLIEQRRVRTTGYADRQAAHAPRHRRSCSRRSTIRRSRWGARGSRAPWSRRAVSRPPTTPSGSG